MPADAHLIQHRLGNGLRVALEPRAEAPGVAVNIYYRVGSFDEHRGRTGFAHLFEHLMFQGSSQVRPGEHMAQIESWGGNVNATTSTDRTNYFETVPATALNLALWLEADRMSSLAVSDENFQTQREVVKEEKRQRYDNQPYGDLLELLISQHFSSDHPYGHLPIGSMADLAAASLPDVQDFFDSWYRPNNATMVLVGSFDPNQAIELVEEHFGEIPAAPIAARRPAPPSPFTANVIETRESVPHEVHYYSWPTPQSNHADQVALELALGLLTSSNTSRLHRQLVKDTGTALEVHGAMITHLYSDSISAISLRPTRGQDPQRSEELLRGSLSDFIGSGPTPEELERAKAQYERDWLVGLSTIEGRADLLNDAWLQYDDPTRADRQLDLVYQTTAADLQRVVADYLAFEPARLRYLPLKES